MRRVLTLLALLVFALPASAQLARSYYNVTGIKSKKLANAVQVLIQTDGNVAFDVETTNLFERRTDFSFANKTTSEVRLRLVGARIKVPTFNEVATYPVDSAVVSLGNEPLKTPFSVARNVGNFGSVVPKIDPSVPQVDVVVRFYVPVTIGINNIKTGSNEYESDYESYRPPLGPREAKIELTPDRRAIQITVVLDRVEAEQGEQNLKRSPTREHHHILSATKQAAGLQLAALHTPLPELLERLGTLTQTSLRVQPDAADIEVSLNLPNTTLAEVLQALSHCYGLSVQESDSGFLVGRGGGALVTQQLILKHLTPSTARALLPDFLLPRIRTDEANNALVVTASPELVERVRADLEKLDRPRLLVRVAATAYELVGTESLRRVLAITQREAAVSPDSAQLAITLPRGQEAGLTATLRALESLGKLRVVAKPSVTVASGAKGTVFAGQDRFIQVLTNNFGVVSSQALRLPIGTELTVTPRVGEGGEITLQLQPRFTNVEEVEAKTGLPTLGISTFDTTVRLKPGETALVGSLELDSDSARRRPGVRARDSQKTLLLLLITATLVTSEKTP